MPSARLNVDSRTGFELGDEMVSAAKKDQRHQAAGLPTGTADMAAQRDELKRQFFAAQQAGLADNAPSEARRLLVDVCARLDQLVSQDPQHPALLNDYVVAQTQLGEVCLRLDETEAAQHHLQLAITANRKLSHCEPADPVCRRCAALSYDQLGDLVLRLGDAETARRLFKQARRLHGELVAAHPNDPAMIRDLTVSNNRLGEMSLRLGKLESARDYFQQSVELRTWLLTASQDETAARRDLAVSLVRLGDVCLRLDDLASARRHFERLLELQQATAKLRPHSARARRDLAVAYHKLGAVAARAGHYDEAQQNYTRWLEIAEALAADDPASIHAQGELAYCLGCLGTLEMQSGDFETAQLWFARGVGILEAIERAGKLAELPAYRMWLADQRRDLEVCRENGWTVDGLDLQRNEASASISIEAWRSAIAVAASPAGNQASRGEAAMTRLDDQSTPPETMPGSSPVPSSAGAAASLPDSNRARHDWQFLLAQPDEVVAVMLTDRAQAWARAGRFDRVTESIEQLRRLPVIEPAQLFEAAVACAWCVETIRNQSASLAPDDTRDLLYWTELAIRHLREAIALGFGDLERLRCEPAWQSLREHRSIVALWQPAAV